MTDAATAKTTDASVGDDAKKKEQLKSREAARHFPTSSKFANYLYKLYVDIAKDHPVNGKKPNVSGDAISGMSDMAVALAVRLIKAASTMATLSQVSSLSAVHVQKAMRYLTDGVKTISNDFYTEWNTSIVIAGTSYTQSIAKSKKEKEPTAGGKKAKGIPQAERAGIFFSPKRLQNLAIKGRYLAKGQHLGAAATVALAAAVETIFDQLINAALIVKKTKSTEEEEEEEAGVESKTKTLILADIIDAVNRNDDMRIVFPNILAPALGPVFRQHVHALPARKKKEEKKADDDAGKKTAPKKAATTPKKGKKAATPAESEADA